ncbi:MAG: FAD-linked oxidase C-terminal domain-containing protein [Nitrospirota bacterium]|nr:FAD-linked oxidase C-terminal domain-containing protein [Nitrospirota bacterium]
MNELSELLPGKISTEPEDLVCYGFDASGLEAHPSAVVWPLNVSDVVKIMNFAYANGVPVVPRGAGTGMTGGAIPSGSAIVISFERMNRILDVDRENLTVLVEPGVINGKLQRELERHQLFFPPDPTSMNFCTIGGNVAENAGGPRAVKYGVTRDYVMGLEAVLPDGKVINTGKKTAKGVVGYDLTSLLTGSEGTLAVITEIRLKTLPLPEDVITLLVLFRELEQSGNAVSDIISHGIIPRTLEFLDREAINAVENYKPVGLPRDVAAMLLIELDGAPSVINREAEQVYDICGRLGGDAVMAEDSAARNKLWESRRALSPALYHLSPSKINEDIVVPRSRIPDMLKILSRLSEETGIKIVNFGHAGDGNIHVNLMVDRNNREEYGKARKLVKEIFGYVLGMGGTISGEHGIGLTKSDYISMEIKPEELDLMKKIKNIFDPGNILNPGKIFPRR